MLIYWSFYKSINDRCQEVMHAYPKCAYVVEGRKVLHYSYIGSAWCEVQYKDEYGKGVPIAPWKKSLLCGTEAENCKLDLYLKCKGDLYPVSYLRLWVQRPTVENLLVQGVGGILADMIRRDCKGTYFYGTVIPKLKDVNFRDRRPAQMLGLTKEELRWAARQKWTLDELEVWRDLTAHERITPERDFPLVRERLSDARFLLDKKTEVSYMKCLRYLAKQESGDASTLLDYWNMAKENGADLNSPNIRWPQHLMKSHDREMLKKRFDIHNRREPEFKARVLALSDYAWESDGFLIRPIASADELYLEGQVLNHCVYRYMDSILTGDTYIFVIRKAMDPDLPYYTLQLNIPKLKVEQNRGKNNCSRTSAVVAFEEKWLRHLKEITGKEMKTA